MVGEPGFLEENEDRFVHFDKTGKIEPVPLVSFNVVRNNALI